MSDQKKDCFIEIEIGKEEKYRLQIELFWDQVPKTCENFRQLCIGNKQGLLIPNLHYKGSKFHRIIPGFMAQGGDFVNQDGSGQECIYGLKFEDENFEIKHDKKYLVGMVNNGPNTNSCQFYITFDKCPWLDGKNVIFGEVVNSQQALKNLEKNGSQTGEPQNEIIIVDSGEI
ncbi:Cyclophilin-like peptidyl-prolyl cis-trans isomerase domain [Pseudocohnilembus persalinus]|uniref:Peptidyl-prolyl cis-trans isomerase n=1 Tax=Pseudocohnilembus persalinus TaxID=266149 RepID=A0A0V0R077_PSEPJ|nr:Cyclophilin-like peptidyl-prolyl cis-trans isomerase domain [Pseudocohnilembus persalinus]|eukprot:KRX07942.1 Cyclophilin-like peptidyl-prolyl cis-trans isomerase domain [Pseudocohnilembus persalinus]